MQFFIIALDGIIKETDNTLFHWKEGSSIFDAHPFFDIIHDLLENKKNKEHTFTCIHFEESSETKYVIVTISFDLTEIIVAISDHTSKYLQLTEALIKNKDLELKCDLLLKKEESKNNLIANVNHQIKTPITGILGFTEVLEKTPLSFEQEELINIIKQESKHLDAIVTDMLNVSKIEAGNIEIKNETFDFAKLIQGIKEKYQYLAKEKNIDFEVYLDTNIQKELIGDQLKTRQILINLLNNAFRYTKEGKISLKVTKNFQRTNNLSINFNITDSSPGIAEENLKYIFDRFTRLHEDKQVSGTGLGLTIVKKLVDLMEGNIKVNSKINTGSTFSVSLPFKFKIVNTKEVKKQKNILLQNLVEKLGFCWLKIKRLINIW